MVAGPSGWEREAESVAGASVASQASEDRKCLECRVRTFGCFGIAVQGLSGSGLIAEFNMVRLKVICTRSLKPKV